MIHIPHDLGKFVQGAPVVTDRYFDGHNENGKMVGHVQGFALNSMGEVILRIQWATGEVVTIHTAHVQVI